MDVISGGGTAGLALANRLSENQTVTDAVVEAVTISLLVLQKPS